MNDDLFNSENILDGGVNLFGFEDEGNPDNPEEQEPKEPENPEEKNNKPTEEPSFTGDDLFGEDDENPEEEANPEEETPESVGGNKKDKKATEETNPNNGGGSSPNGQTLSSLAKALYGDGLFQSLEEEDINGITDAESFYDAIDKEVNSRLDEKTRRIQEAMEAGVQVGVIKQYEDTIQRLNGITDDALSEDSAQGKNLRKTILLQDYIDRGFTKDRAEREVERTFKLGSDIDDARDALESVKEFFEGKYNDLIEEGKAKEAEEAKRIKEEAAQFKKAVLETEKVFGEISVDKATRQKAYQLMTKVVKTTDEGERLTAVQLYADEHPVEFRTMLGIVAALTDGFTKPGNLLKATVDKKVRSNLKQFEAKLNGTSSHRGGTISFAEGEEEEPEVRHRGGFRLDI